MTTTNESERNKHLASDEKQTPVKNSLCLPDEVGDGEENSNNQTKEKGMVSKLKRINRMDFNNEYLLW